MKRCSLALEPAHFIRKKQKTRQKDSSPWKTRRARDFPLIPTLIKRATAVVAVQVPIVGDIEFHVGISMVVRPVIELNIGIGRVGGNLIDEYPSRLGGGHFHGVGIAV
jgi:hypothetical protein